MHDYIRFGIVSMQDRVRLFKLVQIVKSVQDEGMYCKHDNGSTYLQRNPYQYQAQRVGQQVQNQGQRDIQKSPKGHIERKTHSRIVEENSSKAPKPHPPKTSSQSSNQVEYRPGTGSPIFKCRKVLTFSDSDSEDEPKPQIKNVKNIRKTHAKQSEPFKPNEGAKPKEPDSLPARQKHATLTTAKPHHQNLQTKQKQNSSQGISSTKLTHLVENKAANLRQMFLMKSQKNTQNENENRKQMNSEFTRTKDTDLSRPAGLENTMQKVISENSRSGPSESAIQNETMSLRDLFQRKAQRSLQNDRTEQNYKGNLHASQPPGRENLHASQLPGRENLHASHLPGRENLHASQLPGRENLHASQLPDRENLHASQLPGRENLHASQLPGRENVMASQLPGRENVMASQLPGRENLHASQLPGRENLHASQLSGRENLHASHLPGKEIVYMSQLPGKENVYMSQLAGKENVERENRQQSRSRDQESDRFRSESAQGKSESTSQKGKVVSHSSSGLSSDLDGRRSATSSGPESDSGISSKISRDHSLEKVLDHKNVISNSPRCFFVDFDTVGTLNSSNERGTSAANSSAEGAKSKSQTPRHFYIEIDPPRTIRSPKQDKVVHEQSEKAANQTKSSDKEKHEETNSQGKSKDTHDAEVQIGPGNVTTITCDQRRTEQGVIIANKGSLMNRNTQVDNVITIGPKPEPTAFFIAQHPALKQSSSALFKDNKSQENHAYFPAFSPPKEQTPKPPHIERIVHNSDYDYGVPGKTNQRKNSQGTPRSQARKDKIQVCVRKRPLTKRETKRQELDIVKVEREDVIVVEEAKVAIDLSKYIQQVSCSMQMIFIV